MWKHHRQLGSRGPLSGCIFGEVRRKAEGWKGESVVPGERVGAPKPPQSATTKTLRSLFHERPATLLDSVSLHTLSLLTIPLSPASRQPLLGSREKETEKVAYLTPDSTEGSVQK